MLLLRVLRESNPRFRILSRRSDDSDGGDAGAGLEVQEDLEGLMWWVELSKGVEEVAACGDELPTMIFAAILSAAKKEKS